MGMILIMLMLAVVLAGTTSSAFRPTHPQADTSKEKAAELSCKVSIPSEVHVVDGYIDANLVIKNTSEHPVKICTLTQGWRSIWKSNYDEVFRPDRWKSDSPRPDEFLKHIVSIEPEKNISLPFKVMYNAEFITGHPLTITAGYETGEEFARRYGIWFGSIRAKPVTVTVIE